MIGTRTTNTSYCFECETPTEIIDEPSGFYCGGCGIEYPTLKNDDHPVTCFCTDCLGAVKWRHYAQLVHELENVSK